MHFVLAASTVVRFLAVVTSRNKWIYYVIEAYIEGQMRWLTRSQSSLVRGFVKRNRKAEPVTKREGEEEGEAKRFGDQSTIIGRSVS